MHVIIVTVCVLMQIQIFLKHIFVQLVNETFRLF